MFLYGEILEEDMINYISSYTSIIIVIFLIVDTIGLLLIMGMISNINAKIEDILAETDKVGKYYE